MAETNPCPACALPVAEGAVKCPYCRHPLHLAGVDPKALDAFLTAYGDLVHDLGNFLTTPVTYAHLLERGTDAGSVMNLQELGEKTLKKALALSARLEAAEAALRAAVRTMETEE